MRKILFLILLICHITGLYSQAPVGTYEVYFIGWLRGEDNHHCGNAYVTMTLNNETIYIFNATYEQYSAPQYFDKNSTIITFNADKNLTKLFFSARRRIESECRGTTHYNAGSISYGLNDPCYTLAFQFSDFQNEEDGDGLWSSSFTLYIRPILKIVDSDPSKNFLSSEDRVTIHSHSHFKYGEYNWQYRINGS
ncbi:MAG: hypothetical protein LBL79_13425, partial [Prevotella sp.]|nr:hypothetical protein [Prevotella sp.]